MRFLITGGCGFLGANLAAEVIRRGQNLSSALCVVDNFFRTGSRENLTWLKGQGAFEFHEVDTRNFEQLSKVFKEFKPDVVFHLAGQVAMTTSLADPHLDFEINVRGGHHVLECVRLFAPHAAVFYSSTNKVYGELHEFDYVEESTRYVTPAFPHGFDEQLRLDFRSPYGCSKGATDQYFLDYARCFGLKTVVFRHSSIFGGRQFSSFDQGWVGWFVQQALLQKTGALREPFTIAGNGKQVRDILFAPDIVRCYFAALDHIDRCAGQAFNIGGGMNNSLSLRELFALIEELIGQRPEFTETPWRHSDQKVFVADIRKATETFSWHPTIDTRAGLASMIDWVSEGLRSASPPASPTTHNPASIPGRA